MYDCITRATGRREIVDYLDNDGNTLVNWNHSLPAPRQRITTVRLYRGDDKILVNLRTPPRTSARTSISSFFTEVATLFFYTLPSSKEVCIFLIHSRVWFFFFHWNTRIYHFHLVLFRNACIILLCQAFPPPFIREIDILKTTRVLQKSDMCLLTLKYFAAPKKKKNRLSIFFFPLILYPDRERQLVDWSPVQVSPNNPRGLPHLYTSPSRFTCHLP